MNYGDDGDYRCKGKDSTTCRPKIGSSSSRQHTDVPLLLKIRNLNNLALSSIGSLFSGTTRSRAIPRIPLQNDGTLFSGDIVLSGHARQSIIPEISSTRRLLLDSKLTASFSQEEDWTSGAQTCNLPDSSYAIHLDPGRNLSLQPEIAVNIPLTRKTAFSHAHTSAQLPEIRCLRENISPNLYDAVQSNTRELGERMHLPYSDGLVRSQITTGFYSDLLTCLSGGQDQRTFHDYSRSAPPSADLETPPLTPDSFCNQLLYPSSSYQTFDYPLGSFPSHETDFDSNFVQGWREVEGAFYTSPLLSQVKEGKKPERGNDSNNKIICNSDPCDVITPLTPIADNQEEWYGLEYTLELSSRERQPSDTQSCAAGEHSRSRESWVAIRRGKIHPFFDDEDYRQWKNWHRFLDMQDEKKRHKKGYEFKALSNESAWMYVEEMRTRDVLYWQKEVYGGVAREMKERLNYFVEQRPDPFFPPMKHTKGWYLKRSRSVGCLREVKPRDEVVRLDKRLVSARQE